jgi:hypothetical protein
MQRGGSARRRRRWGYFVAANIPNAFPVLQRWRLKMKAQDECRTKVALAIAEARGTKPLRAADVWHRRCMPRRIVLGHRGCVP